ncbi:putative Acetylornithine deacetylase [Seiridium cardinale]
MTASVAAGVTVLWYAARHDLPGDIVLASVTDEENASHGTVEVLGEQMESRWGSFVWVEIEISGIAAHGFRSDLGVHSIMNIASVLTATKEYASSLPVDAEESISALWHYPTIRYPSSMLRNISEQHKTFKNREPRVLLQRPSLSVQRKDQLKPLILISDPSWCDATLFSQAGIVTVVLGPGGDDAGGTDS